MNWTKKSEKILSCGISLVKNGVNNWALTRKQSLQALDKFKNMYVPVVGGDVYEITSNGELESNYDSWYCDRRANEELEDFVIRSINNAHEYITNYSSHDRRDVFFVLVPDS